tara:strand:- start:3601 stop:6909 length:3309 start_codon:yes stop_codon:yes gene_type:complete
MEFKLTSVHFACWKNLIQFFMRTFLLLFCSTVFSFSTSIVISQNTKITINIDKTVTIYEVFELIREQTEYTFIYQSDIFKNIPKVHLKKGIVKAIKLLEENLTKKDFSITTNDNYIIIKANNASKEKQDQIKVQGKITDDNGIPLAGVTIRIKGTQKGTSSDFNGAYNISVNTNDVLVFSFVGYKTEEVSINGQTEINIQLETDITALNTIEINAGYYTVKDKERTGNISKIEAKTIEKQPVNNPLASMQGHLAGVNIVQNTSVPGGGYNIEIRGKNFINSGTDPLYIIDGVPFGGQSLESQNVSGQINAGNVSPLNAINTANIESIEVLKDADATAIYGSRGANGVVLITTKKGKAGKTQFKANVSSTIGKVTSFRELMNTQQFLELRREGITNDGFGSFLENPAFDFIWPELKAWDQNHYTDWQKELIGGTAYRNNAQLSVSGGSNQTQFLMSVGHQNETTVFPGDDNYKKTTVHSHLNHQSKDSRFSISLSTNYSIENNQLPRSDFTSMAYRLEPNAPEIYTSDGDLNWENNSWNNPLAALEENYEVQINNLLANVNLTYKLLPELEFKTNLGYNNYKLESYRTLPSSARNPKFGFTPQNYSSITTNNATSQSWIIEPQLNWKHQWGNVKLDVLLGTTFQRETTDRLVLKGTGFPNNNLLQNLLAATTIKSLEDSNGEYSYQAFFGRINVNYKGKYILNLTGRRDGSSRFASGKQFGNFGAVGLAWLFSEEVFLKDNTVLSFGKLRGSYGSTGSDNIGDYKFLNTYNTTGFDYNGVSVIEPTGIFNPRFGWEANKKLEAALELGFFNDRVLLTTAWYQNRSSNQLIGIPLAATTGFNSLTGNFDATVENTGFEVDLHTINLKSKYFKWRTNFNITFPKNKLVKFDGLETSTFANKLVIGKPLTIIHLYQALGVDTDTGLYQFEDFNDDGNITRFEDRQIKEDFAPKFYGGLGNTLSYKNLTLDFFFQFKKQKAFNELRSTATPGFKGNASVILLDRWQEPGDTNPIQLASFGFSPSIGPSELYQSESNAAVSDASFIRLRNISLNYQVPIIKNGMDINIYIQGQNLLTITNYTGSDPERPSDNTLPPLRQITLGIQLGF